MPARINSGFLQVRHRYLFQEVARRVAAFKACHPDADLIRLGIGDVTRPLAPTVIQAMHRAVDDLSQAESFHGYGPENGYDWLREAIAEGDYRSRGIAVDADEIFVNDGAKSDLGNILDLFAGENIVGIPDPVYPAYVDANLLDSRQVRFIPCTEENHYAGEIPQGRLDIIYLCFPNNPTGAVITREHLSEWVRYAREHDSLILFDSAYETFIRDETYPRSIYEIAGADECAIEFRSFSKTAGFTGVRCGYTVIPKALSVCTSSGQRMGLGPLWEFRQGCKFNGASYVAQRGAAAIYTADGRKQTREITDGYLRTAGIIREGLRSAGLSASGGENAPYVWTRTPGGMDDWEFFDRLLTATGIVVTPGSGFGAEGKGHFRITSFGDPGRTAQAMERLKRFVDGL